MDLQHFVVLVVHSELLWFVHLFLLSVHLYRWLPLVRLFRSFPGFFFFLKIVAEVFHLSFLKKKKNQQLSFYSQICMCLILIIYENSCYGV